MNSNEFKSKYGYRRCEKCCGNCKWGNGIDYDGGTDCFHHLLQEGNDKNGLRKTLYDENRGWCMSAYPIYVCDNWEKCENDLDEAV